MEETPRASDLQIQVEQVNLALRQLRQTQDSLNGLETRLADMTRECAGILDRWAKNDERHATAVVELHSRLSEWNDIERRLLNESTTRIHQFERSLQHEWNAIRQSHEEPLRQIEAQTTRITDTCLTAVDQALKGFERAETRLATLEQDLQREMGTLTRELREAVAELRQGAPQLGPRQPWSLDNVVRLHNDLRSEPGASAASGGRGTLALAEAIETEPVPAAHAVPAAAVAQPAIDVTASPVAAAPSAGDRRRWLLGAAAVAVILSGVYGYSEIRGGLRDAALRAEAAERSANEARTRAAEEMAEARRASDARLQAAQRAAVSAQTVSLIATASDLRRFDLVSRQGQGAAQVLWSRTHGLAISGAGIPAPPPGRAYQVWLFTPDLAVSAGLLPVDASGRASAVVEPIADLPRPIVRAAITLEPAAGSSAPTGPAALAPAPPPSSAAVP